MTRAGRIDWWGVLGLVLCSASAGLVLGLAAIAGGVTL